MDSINQNQPEKNHEDLHAREAIKKIKEIVDKAQTCFFCTAVHETDTLATRPMSVQQVDDDGNFWFLSASDSHKNAEIPVDSAVRLFFQGSPHSDFLAINGTASVSRDKAKIHELWEPILKTWFTDGIDDARITVIKVVPTDGYYWDNKHGNAVAGVKMMIGAAMGKTLDDSIEGKVSL